MLLFYWKKDGPEIEIQFISLDESWHKSMYMRSEE